MVLFGYGYDVHRLAEGLPLVLGGVNIPSPVGCVAHSDGDVLLHAVCDALLGAAGLGDIGEHFPDTDARYKGISSLLLLREVVALLSKKDYKVINIDCTLVLEKPKILPFKELMRENIATAVGIDTHRVNVKATTSEKLGFVGEGRGAVAHAVASVLALNAE